MIKYIKINCGYINCNKVFSKKYANQRYCSIKCREEKYRKRNLSNLRIDSKIIRKIECSEKKCHEDSDGWINKKTYCKKHFKMKKFSTSPLFKRQVGDSVYLRW